MKEFLKIIATVLAIVLTLSVTLIGCGNDEPDENLGSSPEATTSSQLEEENNEGTTEKDKTKDDKKSSAPKSTGSTKSDKSSGSTTSSTDSATSTTSTTPTSSDTESSPFEIKTQPTNASAENGGDKTFSVVVSGGTAPYSYQWHCETNEFSPAIKISGETNKTIGANYYSGYYTANLKVHADSNSKGEYWCVITDAKGEKLTTNKAKLSIVYPLKITTQPKSVVGKTGNRQTFSVAVSGGTSPYTYQWYYKKNNSSPTIKISARTFKKSELPIISGYTTANLKVTVNSNLAGEYWCVITDTNGNKITTNKAKLLVTS